MNSNINQVNQSEKPMFADAQVGDTVYILQKNYFEEGKVSAVDNSCMFGLHSICVSYAHGKYEWFDTDGETSNSMSKLFWKTFEIPVRPKRKIKKEVEFYSIYDKFDNTVRTSWGRFETEQAAENYLNGLVIAGKGDYIIIKFK